ncbi:MAG: PrgI family protein [Candidatus Levybacteria bacterium]|nr:PrgI family protein [Candidatus Levybacteria bacterium]
MENHPIPQDVTGFQFRLIGNMTVKQFAYLATGSVLAVIFYYAPLILLIKIVAIPLLVGAGAALAFLPIEGRPMDLMISNFLKDLFNPTQYLYQKIGGELQVITQPSLLPSGPQKEEKGKKQTLEAQKTNREIKLNQYLKQISHEGKNKLDEKEELFLTALFNPDARPRLLSLELEREQQEHQLSKEEALRVKVAQSPEDMEHVLEKEAEAVKKELENAVAKEKQLETTHQQTQESQGHVNELEKQLDQIMEQKKQLEQEILAMRQKQTLAPKKVALPLATLQHSQNVRMIPSDQTASVGLPAIPDVPNIIIGIVKDARGNVLPNILVEIKDLNESPIRAFKTNGLGQFASATPLSNGSYTVELEDPKGNHSFEKIAIEAKGEIMLPYEIISHDAREQLRKELFN